MKECRGEDESYKKNRIWEWAFAMKLCKPSLRITIKYPWFKRKFNNNKFLTQEIHFSRDSLANPVPEITYEDQHRISKDRWGSRVRERDMMKTHLWRTRYAYHTHICN